MQFKIVTLDCPYDQWGDPEVQEMFVKIVQLKLKGYKSEYPYGVLPVDTTDFVGVHHVVCIVDRNFQLQPVMAYRSIYLDRCKIHNLAFPMLSMVKGLQLKEHTHAVEEKVNYCEKNNLKLSYDSSWTIDPELRKDKAIAMELHKIMNAMHILFHTESKTDHAFIGGALRFKMDRYFGKWGYSALKYGSEDLSGVALPSFFNEKIKILYLENGFTEQSLNAANEYYPLWNSRIVFKKDINKEDKANKEKTKEENNNTEQKYKKIA